jgi:DNA polymerase III gamma/tau subunit
MQNLSNLTKNKNLHHFNIVENGSEMEITEICANVLNFDYQANPNYFYKKYDSFLVDDSRDLVELQNRKHKAGDSAVFIVECGSINVQAQNALLKVFEEAHSGTYFFLLILQSNILLPTLLSRAVVYRSDSKNVDKKHFSEDDSKYKFPNLKNLQKMSVKDRMDLVTNLLNDYKKEKISKSEIKLFLNSLTEDLNKDLLSGKIKSAQTILHVDEKIEFFNNNGAHLKSLLEFIVLTI